MSGIDNFTSYHEELLEGHYDCVDRIVVNAYFEYAQSAGGFRSWWRALMGSDETLDRAHLERMAGRFKRRLEAYAKKNKIPFLLCEAGERKHEKAEPYVPQDSGFKGVFLILVGRAPAPVWEVERNHKNQITNLYRKKKWPYVNHYHIHLMDPEWGHVTIRICGYPPFGAQVIANGHEWVERQARKRSLPVKKEGNCFTGGADFQALNQIAKTLRATHAVGRLTKVCDRWLYSACLCFALVVKWPRLLKTMEQYLNDFLNIVQAAQVSFLDQGTFDTLAAPTQRGNRRQAGVDFNKVRMRRVAAAVVALAPQPIGFTVSDLARKVSAIAGPELEAYNSRRAAYDLSKVRGKGLVERIGKSRRYRTTSDGVGKLGGYTILRDQVIKPLMAGVVRRQGRPPKTIHPVDQHYQNLRVELYKTFETLGLAVA